jgi:type I restriction enzyme S subunit
VEIKSGYKQTDLGVIPVDWSTITLESSCVPGGLVRGPFGGALKKEIFIKDGKKVYEQRNAIYRDVTLGSYFIDDIKFSELKRFEIKAGDFIVSCSGTIGCIFKIPQEAAPGLINQALLKITINDDVVDSDYFYYYFDWEYFRQKIIDNTHGGAMQNLVGMNIFRNVELAHPPLPEQRAIAAALSDVDALISSLDRLLAKKRDLKHATMQQLLTGHHRLPGFHGKWETIRFSDLADKSIPWSIVGGPFGSSLKTSDYTEEGVRIIQLQNIGDGYFYDDYAIYTSEEKADELLSNNIYPGEIILSKMGDPVARACFIPTSDPRYLMASDGIRLAVDSKQFNKRFVHDYINSDYFRKNAIEASTGSTRQRIGLGELKQLPFIKPTLDEQIAIAEVLSDMDDEIATLERRRDKTRLLKQGMMQELLTGRIRLI